MCPRVVLSSLPAPSHGLWFPLGSSTNPFFVASNVQPAGSFESQTNVQHEAGIETIPKGVFHYFAALAAVEWKNWSRTFHNSRTLTLTSSSVQFVCKFLIALNQKITFYCSILVNFNPKSVSPESRNEIAWNNKQYFHVQRFESTRTKKVI